MFRYKFLDYISTHSQVFWNVFLFIPRNSFPEILGMSLPGNFSFIFELLGNKFLRNKLIISFPFSKENMLVKEKIKEKNKEKLLYFTLISKL